MIIWSNGVSVTLPSITRWYDTSELTHSWITLSVKTVESFRDFVNFHIPICVAFGGSVLCLVVRRLPTQMCRSGLSGPWRWHTVAIFAMSFTAYNIGHSDKFYIPLPVAYPKTHWIDPINFVFLYWSVLEQQSPLNIFQSTELKQQQKRWKCWPVLHYLMKTNNTRFFLKNGNIGRH